MDEQQTGVYARICLTRQSGRATALDHIENICTDFIELHGDRRFADDRAIVAGLARIGNMPVTVIGIEKGRNLAEKKWRNFGAVLPEGYRKALRLMKQAEKFSRPVVCFVDTQGANCGKGAEERGAGEAIAENLYEISGIKTPILSIMIGEGGSGGALALAVADSVWMLENAYYSVITPESCASILFKDPKRAPEAAERLRLTAQDLLQMQVIERIVSEPHDFTDERAKDIYMHELKNAIVKELKKLKKQSVEGLLEKRYEKYRKIGRYQAYSSK